MSRALFETRLREAEEAVTEDLAALDRKRPLRSKLDFVAHHRELAVTLSLAKHRRYDPSLVDRLNALVVRAHAKIHGARTRSGFRTGLQSLLYEFPRRVRSFPRTLLLASLFLFGSYLATFFWLVADPDAAYAVLPHSALASMEQMYDPEGPVQSQRRGVADDLAMFGFYIQNNIGIAFKTFGSGFFFGVGSVFVLLFNGVVIGASHAHVVNRGFGDPFHAFVASHAGFELFAIALSGLAGIHVGLAFVAPGRRSRKDALVARAREVAPILWGTFVMLVIAAALEAFLSPRELPLPVKLGVGAANALALVAFFSLSGSTRAPR